MGPRRRCAHRHGVAIHDSAAGCRRLSCGEVPAAGTDRGTRATPGLPSRESCGHGRTGPAPPTSRMGLAPYPSPCSWHCAVPRCRARARARPHRCATTATTSTLSGALTGRQPSPVPLNTTGMQVPRHSGTGPLPPLGIPPAAPPAPRYRPQQHRAAGESHHGHPAQQQRPGAPSSAAAAAGFAAPAPRGPAAAAPPARPDVRRSINKFFFEDGGEDEAGLALYLRDVLIRVRERAQQGRRDPLGTAS